MLHATCLQSIILTSDIGQARAFYSDVLGLSFKGESIGAMVYDVAGAALRVSPVAKTVPSEHTALGFAVDDLAPVIAALAERGVALARFAHLSQDERGLLTTSDGSRVGWFRDPDGNILSIVQYSSTARLSD